MDEAAIWNNDAPDGLCWECPDCGHQASLGGNMGYHRAQTGHTVEPPALVRTVKADRGGDSDDYDAEAAALAAAEALIADWLDRQAAAEVGGLAGSARAGALHAADEVVRQGRARREGGA